MLDAELLALLVCPETRQPVRLASAAGLTLLNESIRLGQLRTVAGEGVTELVDGVLLREDGAVAYPIRDGIPVMLVPEGLAVAALKLDQELAVRG